MTFYIIYTIPRRSGEHHESQTKTADLAEFREVVLHTEGALPETALVVPDRVGIVQLFSPRLPMSDPRHLACDQLT